MATSSEALELECMESFDGSSYRKGFLSTFLPLPRMTVTEWADAHRWLPRAGAAEYGQWKTSRTPYLREIQDCLSPFHPAREIVFAKCSQVGATEVGENWAYYTIDHNPGPMLTVFPTLAVAQRHVKQRVNPSIAACSPPVSG